MLREKAMSKNCEALINSNTIVNYCNAEELLNNL